MEYDNASMSRHIPPELQASQLRRRIEVLRRRSTAELNVPTFEFIDTDGDEVALRIDRNRWRKIDLYINGQRREVGVELFVIDTAERSWKCGSFLGDFDPQEDLVELVRRRNDLFAARQKLFKVACLGDSCTYGTGLAEPDKYPRQLQRILEEHGRSNDIQYDVQMFGRCGTRAGDGAVRYIEQKRFLESVAFAADAYVIMLGTNDAWHGPEPTTFSFTKGLTDIVQWIRNAHPGCSVLLVLPPGCKDGRCSRNLANIVHPAVRDVAKAEHTFLVEPDLSPQSCYAKDKIHLSAEGASTVAAAVARAVESTIASAVARSVETVEPARKRRKPTGKLNDGGISHRTWQAL